jgi:hypothetical protein
LTCAAVEIGIGSVDAAVISRSFQNMYRCVFVFNVCELISSTAVTVCALKEQGELD